MTARTLSWTATDRRVEEGVTSLHYPPGPRLPAALQALLFAKYPHRVLPVLRRRYGDVVAIRLPRAAGMVLLADPADIRTVFSDSRVFRAGEANEMLRPIVGAESVVVLDDEQHRRLRRLLTPPFNGAALRGYGDMIAEAARAEFETWPADRVINVHHRMAVLTIEVILKVVFGVTDPGRIAQLRPLVGRILDFGPLTLLGLQYPRLRRFGPWKRYIACQRRLDALLDVEIAARRAATDLAHRTDVLSRLLRVTDDDGQGLSDAVLHDQLISSLVGGHETVAASLAWTVHELARRPGLLAAAQRAARLDDTDYLMALVKESLRIRPIVFAVVRKLAQPVQIGGFAIPAGTVVAPCISLVHADPVRYEDPEEFRPERFLGSAPAPNTWIPFGGGARRCLGAAFATMESAVVIQELLNRFHVSPALDKPERPRARAITLVPSGGSRITVTVRNASPDVDELALQCA